MDVATRVNGASRDVTGCERISNAGRLARHESRPQEVTESDRRGRLHIIAAKGLGRLDGLYRELAVLGWQTSMAEIDDRLIRYTARALGLRPTLASHRRVYLAIN